MILSSTLKHLDEAEINMFKVGVTFSETTEWPIPAFVIKPIQNEEQQVETELDALD